MNKTQLHKIIKQDRSRYGKLRHLWLRRILQDETARIVHILKILRFTEYYDIKKLESEGLFKQYIRLIFVAYRLYLYYLCSKNNLYLPLHKIGPGLRIVHLGGAIRIGCKKMGENCTVNAGVIIGKIKTDDRRPIIGDNVDCSVGSKIIGKVNIGSNSIIAPNSVVIKDVPNNCIVSGVPAKIIRINGEKIYSFYDK